MRMRVDKCRGPIRSLIGVYKYDLEQPVPLHKVIIQVDSIRTRYLNERDADDADYARA